MNSLLENPRFRAAYGDLARVTLNPRRHTSPNAHAHSEAVSRVAGQLGRANGLADDRVRMLEELGRAHDIGKITGSARPERSLDVLRECGIDDPNLLALVKWHDTSLPWFRAHERGQPPSEKAWRRLQAEVDADMLALFCVADREDAPAGWRRNEPTAWFLEEAKRRGLVRDLRFDLPGVPSEVSAGTAVVHDGRALLIRIRRDGYELPKGGIEWDELPQETALRETREETGLAVQLTSEHELGHVDYDVGDPPRTKRARYFAARAASREPCGADPRVRELRWITRDELSAVQLVHPHLRAIVARALDPRAQTA